jgi:hypothetical protein
MITNEQYLVQKFSEAREKMETYSSNDSGRDYWRGSMDTYHNLLSSAFPGWAEQGTTGYYVFIEQKTYEEAINLIHKSLQNA